MTKGQVVARIKPLDIELNKAMAEASVKRLKASIRENDDASVIRRLCEEHEMDLEEVNRALLRVLSDLEVERPAPPR